MGLLLQQYLHMCGQQLQYNTDPASRQLMGKQLLELFTHLVQQSEQRLLSPASDTRRAHLQRIKHYVRHHLDNPALDPHTVAAACHISVRYLHDLFGDTDTSFSQWLKQQRLATAHHLLTRPHFQQTLAARLRPPPPRPKPPKKPLFTLALSGFPAASTSSPPRNFKRGSSLIPIRG